MLKRLLYLSTPRKVFVRDFPRALGKPATHRAQFRLLSFTKPLRCQSESSGGCCQEQNKPGHCFTLQPFACPLETQRAVPEAWKTEGSCGSVLLLTSRLWEVLGRWQLLPWVGWNWKGNQNDRKQLKTSLLISSCFFTGCTSFTVQDTHEHETKMCAVNLLGESRLQACSNKRHRHCC